MALRSLPKLSNGTILENIHSHTPISSLIWIFFPHFDIKRFQHWGDIPESEKEAWPWFCCPLCVQWFWFKTFGFVTNISIFLWKMVCLFSVSLNFFLDRWHTCVPVFPSNSSHKNYSLFDLGIFSPSFTPGLPFLFSLQIPIYHYWRVMEAGSWTHCHCCCNCWDISYWGCVYLFVFQALLHKGITLYTGDFTGTRPFWYWMGQVLKPSNMYVNFTLWDSAHCLFPISRGHLGGIPFTSLCILHRQHNMTCISLCGCCRQDN